MEKSWSKATDWWPIALIPMEFCHQLAMWYWQMKNFRSMFCILHFVSKLKLPVYLHILLHGFHWHLGMVFAFLFNFPVQFIIFIHNCVEYNEFLYQKVTIWAQTLITAWFLQCTSTNHHNNFSSLLISITLHWNGYDWFMSIISKLMYLSVLLKMLLGSYVMS